MSPKIHPTFWSDEQVELLTAEDKLVLLWLITNPQTNLIGQGQVSPRRFQLDTGLTPDALKRACDALRGNVWFDGKTYWIRNYIRHQFGSGEKLVSNKIFKAILSAYCQVKDDSLRQEINRDYPELAGVEEGDGMGIGRGKIKIKIKNREGEREGTAPTDSEWQHVWERGRIILAYLNQKSRSKFRDSSDCVDPIAERLFETKDEDGLRRMIDRQVSLWANDTKMSGCLRPQTLFGEKFHGYYGQRDIPIQGPNNSSKTGGNY